MNKKISIAFAAAFLSCLSQFATAATANYVFPAISVCRAAEVLDAPLFDVVTSRGSTLAGIVNTSGVMREVVCGLPMPVYAPVGRVAISVHGSTLERVDVRCGLTMANLVNGGGASSVSSADSRGRFVVNLDGNYKYDADNIPIVVVTCELPANASILGLSMRDTY